MEDLKKIQFILSEDLEEAINKLQVFFVEQPAQLQEFILIKGKFNQICKDRRIGVITDDLYYVETQKIRDGLLKLTNFLSEEVVINKTDIAGAKGVSKDSFDIPNINTDDFPILEVEIIPVGAIKKILELSPNNKTDANGSVWMMNAIYLNDVIWNYDIIIRNKSKNIAYNAGVFFPTEGFTHCEELNVNILPESQITLKAEYNELVEGTGVQVLNYIEKISKPEELSYVEVILTYKNKRDWDIMTVFIFEEGKETKSATTFQWKD